MSRLNRAGVAMILSGWALTGLGMLLFPDSNLLGGLGPLGMLTWMIGFLVLTVGLLSDIVRRMVDRRAPPGPRDEPNRP